jgi:hypothetical protein
MGQQLNIGSKVKTLAKATGLIIKINFNCILMLDKLLILDPKPGDLTMSRFVNIRLK